MSSRVPAWVAFSYGDGVPGSWELSCSVFSAASVALEWGVEKRRLECE